MKRFGDDFHHIALQYFFHDADLSYSYTTPNHKCHLMFLYQYIDGVPTLYQKKVQAQKLLNE